MIVTWRKIGTMTAGAPATAVVPGWVATAAAAGTVRFGFRRSSTPLTPLNEDRTLDPAFGTKGFGVGWAQFDDVIIEMNAAVRDFHADCADAVPTFTQSAEAPLTFYAGKVNNPQAESPISEASSSASIAARAATSSWRRR